MAISTIQFGQCGNQVGQDFFATLVKDMCSTKPGVSSNENDAYIQNSVNRWFEEESESGKLTARAVLVDTENKVVQELLTKQSSSNQWSYSSRACAVGSGGAGNNWALGYQRKGPELLGCVLEALRIQNEKCDRLAGILSIMSSAGGTGSGVGSFVMEHIHDEYSKKVLFNAVVLPFEEGEVVTQSYNTLLTLTKLWNVSDASLLFHNDHVHRMILNLLHLKTVGVNDLNSLISLKLVGSFQPSEDSTSSAKLNVPDLISYIAPHPAYKFFSIKSSPHIPKESKKFEGGYHWNVLTKHMRQMLKTNAFSPDSPSVDWELKQPSSIPPSSNSMQQFSCSVANVLITRGVGFSQNQCNPHSDFLEKGFHPLWVPAGAAFTHCHQSRRFSDQDKFACLVSNNGQIYCPLNSIVEKAWKMFTHKAYMHQYTRFGLTEEDFVDAFVKLETVVKAYRELSKSHTTC